MSAPGAQAAHGGPRPGLRLAWLWWVLGWAMVLYVTVSCLEPAHYVPNLHLWDKAEHSLAFFGMTAWFGGVVRSRRYPVLALLMLLLGGGIEIAQGSMGLGRDADIMDWVADAVGIALALGLLYLGLGGWTRWIEGLVYSSRERS
jgi:VanZ family protein